MKTHYTVVDVDAGEMEPRTNEQLIELALELVGQVLTRTRGPDEALTVVLILEKAVEKTAATLPGFGSQLAMDELRDMATERAGAMGLNVKMRDKPSEEDIS